MKLDYFSRGPLSSVACHLKADAKRHRLGVAGACLQPVHGSSACRGMERRRSMVEREQSAPTCVGCFNSGAGYGRTESWLVSSARREIPATGSSGTHDSHNHGAEAKLRRGQAHQKNAADFGCAAMEFALARHFLVAVLPCSCIMPFIGACASFAAARIAAPR